MDYKQALNTNIPELEKKIKNTYYEMQCTKSHFVLKDLKRHVEKLERLLSYAKKVQS